MKETLVKHPILGAAMWVDCTPIKNREALYEVRPSTAGFGATLAPSVVI